MTETPSRSRPPRPPKEIGPGTATVRAAVSSRGQESRPIITLKGRKKQTNKPPPEDLIALLHKTFPAAFTFPPKPLALGIDKSLRASGLWPLKLGQSRRALYYWTQQPEYKAALKPGAPRYALDGSQCGEVE